ncbi:MAG: DUF4197 domain-containing protein [Saprospiraceae bacterium]|nr:DUF4197 domain-containing protein [Saprospiraceae bacterium]MCF8249313.1 DUF4197 domain-containing protein [Saprospiraceae bacterium]MCF8279734.1 DUF4197 domain-containing protein [Bacteroidales bacterium]MCF8311410.1 DUF4197 domain-containing protein [Saprospiraceae bacterium]MCF8439932.1 DUF4197 domain-containing protein [Saprospiraceae bacterium]
MIKKILPLALLMLTFSFANAQLKGALDKAKSKAGDVIQNGGLSQDEAGKGLKEALNRGVGEASDFLSKEDGYYKSPYKILLPDEAQKVVKKLKGVPGFENVEGNLVEKMNRAAEDAAVKAKPIFLSAIKSMTFKDAMNILMGNDDAATRYLEGATFKQLYAEFMPIIQESLDKVGAREYWRTAVTAYNKIPFVEKTNPELDDHVNRKALGGLFGLVEKKELGIRSDVSLRDSELLKKVFEKQDSRKKN